MAPPKSTCVPRYIPCRISVERGRTVTVELKKEKENREKPITTPAKIVRRVGSMRVSYGLVIAVVCWFAFALVIYVVRVLGFLDGR